MADAKTSGVAVLAIGAGVVSLYAGITGKDVLSLIKAGIQGKSPHTVAQTAPITSDVSQIEDQAANSASDIAGNIPVPGDLPGGGSPTANKALGLVMAAAYGWTGEQWDYLESGWQEESGWSTTAANNPSDPYNNAYGIPQANPGTKMASAGANWKTSAYTQIKWGLGYIKTTYGSPMQVPLWSANGPLSGYEGY